MRSSRRLCFRPSQPSRVPDARHALRLLHLDRAVRRWLGAPEDAAARGDRLVGSKTSSWLHGAGDRPLFEQLPKLVEELQACLPAARERSAGDFVRAFAGALMQQAFSEVAREAARSGRAEVFACMRQYLQDNPSGAELAQLAQALAMSPQAIELALGSMRRRLRGRIEAALDLWSDTPDSRDTLRRHMRAAFTEPSP